MKLLVNVSVPAISKSFDMMLPDFLPAKDLIPLIAEAVVESTDGEYVSSEEEALCVKSTNEVMHPDKMLSQYGIGNGDTIVLI